MYEEGKVTPQQIYMGARQSPRRLARLPEKPVNNRWSLKVTIILLFLSLLLWGWLKLISPQTLPINTVKITGNYTHVDRDLLRSTVMPYMQNGFLRIDTNGLKDRLLQLPWVANVDIHRYWPDRITINLVEKVPIARFGSDNLVDAQGEIFAIGNNASNLPKLPLFVALQGQQKQIISMYMAASPVLDQLHMKITTLVLDQQQFWRLQLDNGMVLFVGKTQPLERLQRFVSIYPQIIANKTTDSIDYVDLRYTQGLAVHFKNQKVADKTQE